MGSAMTLAVSGQAQWPVDSLDLDAGGKSAGAFARLNRFADRLSLVNRKGPAARDSSLSRTVMKTKCFTLLAVLPFLVDGQGVCPTRHLTIFDANLAEFREERAFTLQSGTNTIEWRSLAPQAIISSLRVTADGVSIMRESITFDGPELRGQKTAVLHLLLKNSGVSGVRKVQVDYLVPRLSWKSDYSLLLGPPVEDGSQGELFLDGWISLQNETGVDVCADTVDLVVGDVQFLAGEAAAPAAALGSGQVLSRITAEPLSTSTPEMTSVSVFSRLRLGQNISIAANTQLDRFPLFQRLKLPFERRNIFENDANVQTLARGGAMLLPRSLEVRLVSRNGSASPLPAGIVTIYSQESEAPQVVGRDRIPFTAVAADFSVTQGRSNALQGTRRIIDRHESPDPSTTLGRKLTTRIEVVITNHGSDPAIAFVRDGVENWGRGDWSVTESSHKAERLRDRLLEFRLSVPPKGSVTLDYTVEVH